MEFLNSFKPEQLRNPRKFRKNEKQAPNTTRAREAADRARAQQDNHGNETNRQADHDRREHDQDPRRTTPQRAQPTRTQPASQPPQTPANRTRTTRAQQARVPKKTLSPGLLPLTTTVRPAGTISTDRSGEDTECSERPQVAHQRTVPQSWLTTQTVYRSGDCVLTPSRLPPHLPRVCAGA